MGNNTEEKIFFIVVECFVGHRLQTPHRYKYTKSVEPYLCLFSVTRFLQDPTNKNKQVTPTPNMRCHQTERSIVDALRRDIHIPKGVYCLLALGW